MSKIRYQSPDVEQYWTEVENVFMQSPGYGDEGKPGATGSWTEDGEDY